MPPPFLTTVSSSSHVLRLVKASVLLALHLLTVFHVANNSLKSHSSMLFHFLNGVVERAFILSYNQLAIVDLAQWPPFFVSIQCSICGGGKLILRSLFADPLFSGFRRPSMTNININTNINTTTTMNQFTVSPPSYNVKISVWRSLLCFCFGPETVVLVVGSSCVSSFSGILPCAVSFLEISPLGCFASCCLAHDAVSLLSVALGAHFGGWQHSAMALGVPLAAVIPFIVAWSPSGSWELLWV